MNKNLIFCFSFIFFSIALRGQNTNVFKGVSYVGYSQFYPTFGTKNFKSVAPWKGLDFNTGNIHISFVEGSIREKNADSTVASIPSRMIRISGVLERPYAFGKTNLFSSEFTPFLLIGGAYVQAPNKIVDAPIYSFGLRLAPGIRLRFSHFLFSLNYDAGLYVNTQLTGQNWEHNTLRRFSYFGGAYFTVAMNSGFDLLFPKMLTAKGYNVSKKTNVKEGQTTYDYKRGLKYTEYIISTVTSYSPGQRTLALIPAFWGIGPMYDFFPQRNRQAATSAYGITTGIRYSSFQLDGFVGKGSIGLKDETEAKDILVTFPQLRNYDFSSSVNMSYAGARLGVNIFKMFSLSNFESSEKNLDKMVGGVTYLRVHGNFTYGWYSLNSAPNYTFKNAESKLEQFQDFNNIESSPENNANLIASNGNFYGWGVNVELGHVFFQTTWYQYPQSKVANHIHYSIGANIPWLRVVNSVRAKLNKSKEFN